MRHVHPPGSRAHPHPKGHLLDHRPDRPHRIQPARQQKRRQHSMTDPTRPAAHPPYKQPTTQTTMADIAPIPRPPTHHRRTRRALAGRHHHMPARLDIHLD